MNNTGYILLINGSIRGNIGNSGVLSKYATEIINGAGKNVHLLTLAESMPSISEVLKIVENASAILAITGNYWGSSGSVMQRFIEVMTPFENTSAFWGKPFSVCVSIDSVGGTDVASNLHAAFSGLGCWSPPCSTVIVSRVGNEAIAASVHLDGSPNDDVWRKEDLNVLLENLIIASNIGAPWKPWPYRKLKKASGEWPTNCILDLGNEVFIN